MTRMTKAYYMLTKAYNRLSEGIAMLPYDLAAFVSNRLADMIIALLAIMSILLLAGCVNSPLALRSIVYNTVQKATTEGKADSRPQGRDSINADKTYSDAFKADLPQDKEAK